MGIIPGALVYATVGAGLQEASSTPEASSAPQVFLTPQVLLSLIGLAVLAMLPVVYKKFKTRARYNSQENSTL